MQNQKNQKLKRDKIKFSDEVTMIARKQIYDDDDQVNKDDDQGIIEEESEEKYQT